MAKQDKNWLVYSGMAIEMFVTIGVFAALGFFIDKKINLSPVFTLVLLFMGVAIAFYRIFKQLNK